jgi:hypothetical protein
MDAGALIDLSARSDATVLQATPATLRMLLDASWAGDGRLKVFCGGEAWMADLSHQVAGAIHSRARLLRERIGYEGFVSELRPPKISARQVGPADIKLADDSRRNELARACDGPLALLWEEYRAAHPDGFGYSWFSEHYDALNRGFPSYL